MSVQKQVKLKENEQKFHNRRNRLTKLIRGDVALIPSAAQLPRGRDQEFPIEQDRDFYYFTGFDEPSSLLVLSGTKSGPRSILYLRDRHPSQEKWYGERLGIMRAKRRFNLDEVRNIETLSTDLPEILRGAHSIHLPLGLNAKLDNRVLSILSSQSGPTTDSPIAISDLRVLTAEMRFVKERDEIASIKHAIDITTRSFFELFPQIRRLSSERHGARVLESLFAKHGAHGLAFDTIFASGKNATTLHHEPALSPIWKKELLLIDAGASYRGYAADITRTVPASGRFTSAQAEIHDLVYEALRVAISKVKPGATRRQIHEAACRIFCDGLTELKILKGGAAANFEEKKYQRFFPHYIGHWLGLDVHDVNPISASLDNPRARLDSKERPLLPGVLLTLEPGLYFDAKDDKIPKKYRGIGVRLEEDILVTANGAAVLTSKLPVARSDIEAMMN
jgi:Xaa-Pro aminopeptidase